MCKGMYEHRRKRDHRQIRSVQCHQNHAAAKSGKDDAHVFHGGIGQNAFHILFHGRIEHAQERRYQPHHHDDKAIGKHISTDEFKDKAAKAVNRHFQHNTAHERRHMGRCRRMRIGQPDMQRHQAGLQGKAGKSTAKGNMLQHRRQFAMRQIGKGKALCPAAQKVKRHQNGRCAQMGHDHILVCCTNHLFLLALMVHEQERNQRHNFPGQNKGKGITCEHHQNHRA